MKHLVHAGAALALALPALAHAQASPDVQSLRREIEALRADYEARLRALESRVLAAEAARAAPTPIAAAPAATAVSPPPAVPPAATAAPSSNPALSLILSGGYTHTRRDPAGYRIGGFPLPGDAEMGPGARGFNLGESELGLSASIDPFFRGVAHIAFSDEGAEVEEAYVHTTALGNGLTAKAGRFLSGVGYLNGQHPHSWDFLDAPLAYQALLGGRYGDDGVQISWVAPTDQFIELKAEIGRGRSFPGAAGPGNGAGMSALSLHTGGDVGASHSWRAGVSMLRARAVDQLLDAPDATGTLLTHSFTGDSRVWVLDGVWKWAPGGNASRTSFKLQGEYLRSTRSGSLVADVAGLASPGDYRVTQSGWYLQGVYQFMPRWRAGLRTERLNPGSPDFGANTGTMAPEAWRARRDALMLDFSPSEFSRLRLQLARDRSRPGASDSQIMLQYQMSLGAHGAHGY